MSSSEVATQQSAPEGADTDALVVVDHLVRHFGGRKDSQAVRAVDDVSFSIRRGETFGLVGESGSGKSTTARLLMRLDQPTSGRVLFDGDDVYSLSSRALRRLRPRMQMVFQDPFASLNRRRTVEQTIAFPIRMHQPELGSSERRERVRELLDLVGLRASHATAYPRQLSGGQCQRVSIARALALGPDFVVLDEAVSAVDVSIQAQILNLLRDLQERLGLTYLFVSHDLAVVRYMSNSIGVMYHGRIVELGSREQLFSSPRHPCTHALLASIPSLETSAELGRELAIVREETVAEGSTEGCRYRGRCPLGFNELCREVEPGLDPVGPGHRAACHYPQSKEELQASVAAHARETSTEPADTV
ncbi:MAG TPA: oligopeptide/dipeptide ABC transporter ATP-binding protein [Gaiellaceae bacterium]|jgi:oligopeptide/dipeptide ABC transporter ATP-binding protein|nr:oligopeptide/dipeptide ABC transporter ATP-binding protein [Gaiellaceae bacterium]